MEWIFPWLKTVISRRGRVFLASIFLTFFCVFNLQTDVEFYGKFRHFFEKEVFHGTFLNKKNLQYMYSDITPGSPHQIRQDVPDRIRNFCNEMEVSRPSLIPDCYESMRPRLWLGKKRNAKVRLVLGMPTILRPVKQYVKTTMKKLLRDLDPVYLNSTLILVMLADEKFSKAETILKIFFENFGYEISSGLIEIIIPKQNFYKKLESFPCLTEGQNQSIHTETPCKSQYLRWRNKQNFDYAYLMAYGSQLGQFYLQMEDDMMCERELFPAVFSSIENYNKNPWVLAEATGRGFRGKMFRSNDTFHLAEYLLEHFDEKPCDWLYEIFVNAQPNPCEAEAEKYPLVSPNCHQGLRKLILRNQDICYHRGRFSSLKGKIVPVHLEII